MSNENSSCLTIKNLEVRYQDAPVLLDVKVDVPISTLSAIIGPNGAGKSTLIKASLELISKENGDIRFWGQSFKSARKRIAYIPQRGSIDWDFPATVTDVVTMGLYAHKGLFGRIKREDKEKVKSALDQVELSNFSNRQISELSGGQQQRVFIARALVQNPDLLLMDEPFAGVDVASEQKILLILQKLVEEQKSILVVHHDLDTVREYFDYIVLLNKSIVSQGPTEDVMTAKNLRTAFGNLVPIS